MKRTRFNRFFPTPSYLEMLSTGIDISDRSIKFVELRHNHGNLEVHRFGEKKVPLGAVVSGKIQDAAAVSRVLKEIKDEYKISFVRASLPEEQMYLFELGVAKTSSEEIHDTIELQLEDHVPLTADEVYFDYEVIEERVDGLSVLVTVAPKTLIEQFVSIFEDAGLTLLSLELEASAAARAAIKKGDDATYMVIDFGDSRSGISIVTKRIPLFTSTVAVGGAMLTDMISKELKISIEEAEKLKREVGLTRNENEKELFTILLNGMSVLRDEINRHFIYWHTHKDEEGKDRTKIDSIIVCGGNANLTGIVDYFKSTLRIETKLINVWTNINSLDNYLPPIPFKESLSYTTSIGLALGDFEYD